MAPGIGNGRVEFLLGQEMIVDQIAEAMGAALGNALLVVDGDTDDLSHLGRRFLIFFRERAFSGPVDQLQDPQKEFFKNDRIDEHLACSKPRFHVPATVEFQIRADLPQFFFVIDVADVERHLLAGGITGNAAGGYGNPDLGNLGFGLESRHQLARLPVHHENRHTFGIEKSGDFILEVDQDFIQIGSGIDLVANALQPIAVGDLGLEVVNIGFLNPEFLGFLVHNRIRVSLGFIRGCDRWGPPRKHSGNG